ncbi:putative nuclear RNA export factor SDE5 isoform X1 [Actinidia eriantha]|uniref:putative nuclear RNA export factor SDE5 isoform X1 n=1 Tax=Actinidia eriantha TaxID=165200 RepID=UPI00258673F6|nr:putative nuclear RNA export factor SDE5 isoform X1 [Actinidia eriantha]
MIEITFCTRVKTEAVTSSISYCDDDKRDLEKLLDAFGSVVSLEDIASAYCQAGRDIYTAGEILCNLQGSTSSSSSCTSKSELQGLSVSKESSDGNLSDKSNYVETNPIASKQKKCSVSMGTVSGVIGREYAWSRPSRNESRAVNKPLKLNSEELPISEIWGEEVPTHMTAKVERMHRDMEEFLFKMLGDGFRLDRNIIQEVLGLCGYDVEKSMERLLDLSASTLEKSDDVFSSTAQKAMEKYLDSEPISCKPEPQCINSARSSKARFKSRNEAPKSDKDRYNLQREVLEALFSVPERSEDASERTRPLKEVRKSRGFGRVVVEPLTDTTTVPETVIAEFRAIENENEENDDSYHVLRKAVKEYWVTMKEYYKAAVDAFANGDHERANKLLEKGHFFKQKAQEADEKSSHVFLQTREEEMSLDLHEHEPKEAIRFLRLHLSSLSGIPSIRYLKVTVSGNTGDTKEGARKRLIVKLLDKESIKWIEESNGKVLVIRLDEINPKRLTFAKKQ